jgi:hypothetical protein
MGAVHVAPTEEQYGVLTNRRFSPPTDGSAQLYRVELG